MRYLRQQNINRRAPYDQRLYVDMTDSIVMTTTNNLLVPKGTTAERPVAPLTGMIRYNTTLNEIEVYQGIGGGSTWRSLRFKEPTQITQQTLGIGNATEVIFGPLNPAPVTVAQSGFTWDITQQAKQIIVLVENVVQISGTNYALCVDPSRAQGNIISFEAATKTITSHNTSVINFQTLNFIPGTSITVSGTLQNAGVYTINTVSSSQITVTQTLQDESQGNTIQIIGPYSTGYHVLFDSPVPLGKAVTVLHGFDK